MFQDILYCKPVVTTVHINCSVILLCCCNGEFSRLQHSRTDEIKSELLIAELLISKYGLTLSAAVKFISLVV